ncbi:hypothetical protein PAXRUDRAFT_74032, partial [Paxillus rubicundulus Ve08.2h10]
QWALDMLPNPLFAPHFVWDAKHLFKHNGKECKHFYMEPWLGKQWCNVQLH